MKAFDVPFAPLEGYCLCEAPGHETTEGGLLVPEARVEEADKALKRLKVVAVGPGEQMDAGRRREVVVEPGGVYWFLFPAYSLGDFVTFHGKKYVVVQSKFVCGRATG